MERQRAELRQELRARRKALSQEQQEKASESLLSVIREESVLEDSQHVAVYLANDGEIDPRAVVQWLWEQGVKCYLPVLNPERKHELLFVRYVPDTIMFANRFGIDEPIIEGAEIIEPQALDLVFMPLTGFSEDGQRMGMGGGFYDRTFAFTETSVKPRLVGLAHECQKVINTHPSEWDVPMQGVVTNQNLYSC